jgi:glycosyltransferase involved in cell wall biosynthesis
MRNILWVGPVTGPDALRDWPGLSPAANRWQHGLIMALRDAGSDVEVMGHIPEPVWPRGRLRVPALSERLSCGTRSRSLSYWNLPVTRPLELKLTYRSNARALLRARRPDGVITYNITAATYAVGMLALERGIPWVAIIADAPAGAGERKLHDRRARAASGRVYLSWSSYQAGKAPSLHLDGGVQTVRARPRDGEGDCRVILYAGSVARYAGVKLLVDAFELCNDDRELWICGKGNDPDVAAAAGRNPRIRRFGYVTDEELVQLANRADVFVNPRGSAGNDGNFPSKVLDYLSYRKPVVSTWTPGLSPEYRRVLVCTPDESPAALASTIEGVLCWSQARRDEYAAAVERFLVDTRSWSRQALRLREWLGTLAAAQLQPLPHTTNNDTTPVGKQK